MKRAEVVQKILDRRGPGAIYLEIGVFRGDVFLRIRAGRKIAVDPDLRIGRWRRLRYMMRNPSNRRAFRFETTSDAFFANPRGALADGVDVAFVDGLHTHEQSYRDVRNCLDRLAPGGVVVLHDCSPATERAARPERGEAHDDWSGDVYRTVLRLRALDDDVECFVLDADTGLGIVRHGTPTSPRPDLDGAAIERIGFAELDAHRKEWLDLRPVSSLDAWLETVSPRRPPPASPRGGRSSRAGSASGSGG
jgi:hypothetical protein